MKVGSLTLWMLVVFGLVTFLTLCDAQGESAEETPKEGGANQETPNEGGANQKTPNEGGANQETPNEGNEESAQGNDTSTEAPAGSNPNPTNNTQPETTEEPEVLMIDQMKTLLATKSSCKARFDVCMAAWINTSTNSGMCDNVKNKKDCLKEKENGNECSGDDYDALKDIACHGLPRALASSLLVCVLPLLAWFFAH